MTGQRIVLGLDGSAESLAAGEWAMAHAGANDTIEAVHCWQPVIASASGLSPVMIDPTVTEGLGRGELDTAVAELERRHPDAECTLAPVLVEGHPSRALLDQAEGADLLVVGSRGRGGFVSTLLGSVSTTVSHHATCPVVIVRPPDQD